jgi:hypothetical protein
MSTFHRPANPVTEGVKIKWSGQISGRVLGKTFALLVAALLQAAPLAKNVLQLPALAVSPLAIIARSAVGLAATTGILTWTSPLDSPQSTNQITVRVTASNRTPVLTAAQSFSVIVVSRLLTLMIMIDMNHSQNVAALRRAGCFLASTKPLAGRKRVFALLFRPLLVAVFVRPGFGAQAGPVSVL